MFVPPFLKFTSSKPCICLFFTGYCFLHSSSIDYTLSSTFATHWAVGLPTSTRVGCGCWMSSLRIFELCLDRAWASVCNGCVGGKAVSRSFKNSFPILLFTFLEKGGLNQVTGFVLHFFFFLVAKGVGGGHTSK